MNWFSVGAQLAGGFGAVIAIAAILFGVALFVWGILKSIWIVYFWKPSKQDWDRWC